MPLNSFAKYLPIKKDTAGKYHIRTALHKDAKYILGNTADCTNEGIVYRLIKNFDPLSTKQACRTEPAITQFSIQRNRSLLFRIAITTGTMNSHAKPLISLMRTFIRFFAKYPRTAQMIRYTANATTIRTMGFFTYFLIFFKITGIEHINAIIAAANLGVSGPNAR